jgi:putative methyltransferase (TIGR04325 family)
MHALLRRGIQCVLPPAIANSVGRALSENRYESRGWTADYRRQNGWEDDSVAAAQEGHWPVLVRNLQGPGPLGVSHLPSRTTREDASDHNIMMSYGYVLARAARSRQEVSILDWGGGLGHYHLYSRALVPDVRIQYHCYDVRALCRAGRRLQPDVQFHDGADDFAGARFDLVIASSVLHYFEDWRSLARTLAEHTGEFLYIARLMTVSRAPSFVVRQHPHSQGYRADFLAWFLNRHETLEHFHRLGLDLLREFVFAETWRVKGAPEAGDCRGFLFRRRG